MRRFCSTSTSFRCELTPKSAQQTRAMRAPCVTVGLCHPMHQTVQYSPMVRVSVESDVCVRQRVSGTFALPISTVRRTAAARVSLTLAQRRLVGATPGRGMGCAHVCVFHVLLNVWYDMFEGLVEICCLGGCDCYAWARDEDKTAPRAGNSWRRLVYVNMPCWSHLHPCEAPDLPRWHI